MSVLATRLSGEYIRAVLSGHIQPLFDAWIFMSVALRAHLDNIEGEHHNLHAEADSSVGIVLPQRTYTRHRNTRLAHVAHVPCDIACLRVNNRLLDGSRSSQV